MLTLYCALSEKEEKWIDRGTENCWLKCWKAFSGFLGSHVTKLWLEYQYDWESPLKKSPKESSEGRCKTLDLPLFKRHLITIRPHHISQSSSSWFEFWLLLQRLLRSFLANCRVILCLLGLLYICQSEEDSIGNVYFWRRILFSPLDKFIQRSVTSVLLLIILSSRPWVMTSHPLEYSIRGDKKLIKSTSTTYNSFIYEEAQLCYVKARKPLCVLF